MLRFGKFIRKIEAEIVVARNALQAEAADAGKFSDDFVEKSAVLYVSENFAKNTGLKEGQIVRVSSGERSVKLKVAISDIAPENGAVMPNSIYSSHLSDFSSFKRFKATIEIEDGKQTTPDEILNPIRK